jgi:SAM-dependent methyltransferase
MTRLYSGDAELYDIAFDWDLGEEVDWLLARLCAVSVLEPACGTGRMLEALARRGVEVAGIDNSPQMLEFARDRLGEDAQVFEADMTDFDLGRTFRGAVCPVGTLMHLTPDELARHFECMARDLDRGARYLVQVGIVDSHMEVFADSHWEAERGETKLRIDCVDEDLDVERGVSRQRLRIEVLAGPRAGEIVEDVNDMTAWTPAAWAQAVEASSFAQVATYDGGKRERPRVEPPATGGLLWHELVRA